MHSLSPLILITQLGKCVSSQSWEMGWLTVYTLCPQCLTHGQDLCSILRRHKNGQPLSPMGSQEPEGGYLGTRNIKPQHTVTNNYSKLFASGKVGETATGRQVKKDALLAILPHFPPHWGWGVRGGN